MAFEKKTWQPRVGEGLNRFETVQTGSAIELINTPTRIDQPGTPLSAENMNDLERRIDGGIGDIFNYTEANYAKYTTGIFNPTITNLGITNISYENRNATYVKIGKLVFVRFNIRGTYSKSSQATTAICLSNLPYAIDGTDGNLHVLYNGTWEHWYSGVIIPSTDERILETTMCYYPGLTTNNTSVCFAYRLSDNYHQSDYAYGLQTWNFKDGYNEGFWFNGSFSYIAVS